MKIRRLIKDFIKLRFYRLLLHNKLSPSVKLQQLSLYHYYRDCLKQGSLPGIENCGYKVFSQFEEDGKLLYVLSLIGMKTQLFIEIGSNDGINSNCANLCLHFGYHGLFVDADAKCIRRGERFYSRYPNPWTYPPKFLCAKVTRENINSLLETNGFSGEVDLLSIDIDGNDYWIWDALEVTVPKVVIIESHVAFGLQNIVVPYDPDYEYPGKHPLYHGASAVAMVKLAKKKGYRLVGANNYGSNLIFVREELCGKELPEKTAEEVLKHPSAKEAFYSLDQIKSMPFITPIE